MPRRNLTIGRVSDLHAKSIGLTVIACDARDSAMREQRSILQERPGAAATIFYHFTTRPTNNRAVVVILSHSTSATEPGREEM